MKIHSLGVELFSADGRTDGRIDIQTDITYLKVALRNFLNRSIHCLRTKRLAFQRSITIIQERAIRCCNIMLSCPPVMITQMAAHADITN
jgi:hypothetical protein